MVRYEHIAQATAKQGWATNQDKGARRNMRTSFMGTRRAGLIGCDHPQSSGRQVDWDLIPTSMRQGAVVVTNGADAIATATTITLTVPIGTTLSKGSNLYFGTSKFVKLGQSVVGTGAPVAGIVVEALVTALTNGDTATVGGNGPKFVPALTIMAQLNSGKVIPDSLIVKAFTASETHAGNTGNGVMTLAASSATAKPGVYRVTFVEPTTNLGTFIVSDPNGLEIGHGVVGTAFTSVGPNFTIADGSADFVSGDTFLVTVVETEDGAACAGLIMTDATEGSLTDASTGYGMVIGGAVYENCLPDAVGGHLTAAQKARLASLGMGFFYETYVDNRA